MSRLWTVRYENQLATSLFMGVVGKESWRERQHAVTCQLYQIIQIWDPSPLLQPQVLVKVMTNVQENVHRTAEKQLCLIIQATSCGVRVKMVKLFLYTPERHIVELRYRSIHSKPQLFIRWGSSFMPCLRYPQGRTQMAQWRGGWIGHRPGPYILEISLTDAGSWTTSPQLSNPQLNHYTNYTIL